MSNLLEIKMECEENAFEMEGEDDELLGDSESGSEENLLSDPDSDYEPPQIKLKRKCAAEAMNRNNSEDILTKNGSSEEDIQSDSRKEIRKKQGRRNNRKVILPRRGEATMNNKDVLPENGSADEDVATSSIKKVEKRRGRRNVETVSLPRTGEATLEGTAGLRKGTKKVTAEELASAEAELKMLPEDFCWLERPPSNNQPPPWDPLPMNHPDNTLQLHGQSVTRIFLQMAQLPLQHMVYCTNMLGRQKYPKSWPTLTQGGILFFIAIIFRMDYVQLASLQSYWKKDDPDIFVANTGISRNKFLKWYESVRLYDPTTIDWKERRDNKIFKVDKYLQIVETSLQSMRNTKHRCLSLDEEMTTFKGRCGLVQVIKGKPRGEGLKYYALCDPKTGYVYSTLLHSSTYIPHQNVWGRIVAVCFKLLSGGDRENARSFLDQGYFVYTDRYYTMVQMNYSMSQRKTFFCGTLRREQRSDLPFEIMWGTRRKPTPKAVKDLPRGGILRRYSSTGETCAMSWMDATLVTFLTSTDNGAGNPDICYRRNPKKKKGARGEVKSVVIQPATGKDFSANMAGVDIHDQNCTTTKKHHKSRRWYVSGVFLQSIDWMAHNSFILFRDFNPDTKVINRNVKKIIAKELSEFALYLEKPSEDGDEEELDVGPTNYLPIPLDEKEVKEIRLGKDKKHLPIKYLGSGRQCQGHSQRVSTNIFCSACHVFLCLNGCFGRFHVLENYLFNDTTKKDATVVRRSQRY